MADVPGVVQFGTVVGFFVSFKEDTADAGSVPDEVLLNGTGVLTPSVSQVRFLGTTPPRWVALNPIPFTVVNGYLLAASGGALVVLASVQPAADTSPIQWTATFALENTSSQPPSVTFEVPSGGTVNLTNVIPATPTPGTVVVLTSEAGSVKKVNGVLPDVNGNVNTPGAEDIVALDARLDVAEGSITTLQSTVSGHTTALAARALTSAVDTVAGDVAAIDTRVDATEAAITTLNTNTDNLGGRVTALETVIPQGIGVKGVYVLNAGQVLGDVPAGVPAGTLIVRRTS